MSNNPTTPSADCKDCDIHFHKALGDECPECEGELEAIPSEKMKALIEELKDRCNPKRQTGNEDLFLEKEGMKIHAYCKSVEALASQMRTVKSIAEGEYGLHASTTLVDRIDHVLKEFDDNISSIFS